MEITEVKVFPVDEEKLKAFVSVVFDHCFMVNDIKIINGRQGLFISMPSRKKKNGEFKDVAHPLNNDTRRMIEELVLGEYERVLAERGEEMESRRRLPPDKPSRRTRRRRDTGPPAATASEEQDSSAAAAVSPDGEPTRKGNEEDEDASEMTLEEVEEVHLRDSFWTVP